MSDKNKLPQNQPLVTFVTPKQDILLYVIQDSRSGPFSQTRAYGSPYPNKAQYPDHELVYISPLDEDGNQKWYYARTRDKQEEYNFEISYPYGGRTDAPRYTRTYFLKREGYSPLTAGSADPVFSTAILIGQELKRIGQPELDSLYVLVERTFDTIPVATEFDGVGAGGGTATSAVYGIKVDFPYNDEAYPRLTWRIPVKHSAYTATADLSLCPVTGYTTLKLIDQEYQQDEKSATLGAWVRVYEKLPSRVNKAIRDDDDWGQVTVFSYRDEEGACPAIGATFVYSASNYKVLKATQSPARGSVIAIEVMALAASASQTGTLKTSSATNENWGSVTIYQQWGLASRGIPAIGSSAGSIGTGYVLTAELKDNDGVYANLIVTRLASTTGTLKTSEVTDKEWGTITRYEQWGLSTRGVPAIGDANPLGTGYVLSAELKDDDGTYANLVVNALPSATGTKKTGSDIDQIFCISQVVTQRVPSSTDMAIYYRGATYTGGKYILDAKLTDDDGEYATLNLKLTDDNSVSFTEYKLDNETGLVFPEVSNYTLGTSTPSGMDVNSSAVYRETKRLGCNFWVSTTSKTTTLTSESYYIVVPGKWPEVLKSLTISPVYDNSNVIAKYICNYNSKRAYIGNCKALYTRTWSKSTPVADTTTTLIPEACYFDGIFLRFSLPAMLHFSFTITENTGSSHAQFKYMVNSKNFPATNYTAWPTYIVQDSNIERYKGGFIKETIRVYAPS